MPEVPAANTHLTTVMIAERMAERLAPVGARHFEPAIFDARFRMENSR
jgi:choline dehydrogenase-like flavoprotein